MTYIQQWMLKTQHEFKWLVLITLHVDIFFGYKLLYRECTRMCFINSLKSYSEWNAKVIPLHTYECFDFLAILNTHFLYIG